MRAAGAGLLAALLSVGALAGALAGALLAGPGMPLGPGRAPGAVAAPLDAALARSFDDPALPALLREPSPGRRALERCCLICHGSPIIAGQRLTLEQWRATVAKMRDKYRAPFEPLGEDESLIVDLLSRALSPETPAAPPALVRPHEGPIAEPTFAALAAALPGADPARGEERYAQACAACHGRQGEGGTNGPRLLGRPPLADVEAFERLLREGRSGMPALPGVTAREALDLLAHLREGTRVAGKPQGAPREK